MIKAHIHIIVFGLSIKFLIFAYVTLNGLEYFLRHVLSDDFKIFVFTQKN